MTFFIYPAIILYFVATGLWLGFFLAQREGLCRGGAWVMAAGLGFHTLDLVLRTLSRGYLPAATPGEALAVFDWALVAAFLFFNWRYPIKVLGVLAAPLAALILSGSLILPRGAGEVAPMLQSFWLLFHIALALLGNAALTLAFLVGILYLIQERQLKAKKFGFFYHRLPSLEQLDHLNYYSLTLGFPLLTGGIISGSLYAQYTLGRFFSLDPKEILTYIAWFIYAVLLHERLTMGWRGRRAALMAIWGFLVLVCTFVAASLWLGGYHSFQSFIKQP